MQKNILPQNNTIDDYKMDNKITEIFYKYSNNKNYTVIAVDGTYNNTNYKIIINLKQH